MNEQWSDPIVDEIREIRHRHAQQFNFDIEAIFADLRKREEEEIAKGRPFIDARCIAREPKADYRRRPDDLSNADK